VLNIFNFLNCKLNSLDFETIKTSNKTVVGNYREMERTVKVKVRCSPFRK